MEKNDKKAVEILDNMISELTEMREHYKKRIISKKHVQIKLMRLAEDIEYAVNALEFWQNQMGYKEELNSLKQHFYEVAGAPYSRE
ncbi:uncharacterized protein METZ01_LOCUS422488 [marine metagenome]|jgi:hypothetical protein|uniref:Uncharacterized protein n=1 Tax=marine metagenome TaxID=408172 RepID=A0A382XFJ8_9ZZZZ|tara:strand:- start:1973 stop:2230 length:258 start_codon:yes stop_codon:yes gene_type:complete